jgi:hypothetical protein
VKPSQWVSSLEAEKEEAPKKEKPPKKKEESGG